MGRNKQTPVRRRQVDRVELLGRHSQEDPVELLLARELGHVEPNPVEDQEKIVPVVKKRKNKRKAKKLKFDLKGSRKIESRPQELCVSHTSDGKTSIDFKAASSPREEAGLLFRLRLFDLINVTVRLPGDELGGYSDRPLSLPIRTSAGGLDVWQIVRSAEKLSECNGIGDLVEDGYLLLDLCSISGSWKLDVRLHESAFLACCPANLPLQHVARAKKYQPAIKIHQFIASICPGPEISNCMERKPGEVISAHQVYSLTDNVQLERVLSTNADIPEKSINGLIPKLRPYQHAALQWMLDRERLSVVGDEWRLAWVVITQNYFAPLTRSAPNESYTGECIYFCPFGGWLARSEEEAKSFTIPEGCGRVQGGILAESMGLGKTVEVIACILENPRPGAASTITPLVPRSLFGKDTSKTTSDSFAGNNEEIGEVPDFTEFGDADDDSSVEATEPEARVCNTKSAIITPQTETQEIYHEKWIEDPEIGSCICGSLIRIEDMRRQTIVICCACREPMHMNCAGFYSEVQVKGQTECIKFRELYKNTSTDARLSRDTTCCPCCMCESADLIKTRATLIVTPPGILTQWQQEIERHTNLKGKPLRVAVYRGIHQITSRVSERGKCRDDSMRWLHPTLLSDNDVVLAPLDALMADLSHPLHSDTSEARLKRKRKKYRIVPSPLLKLDWWRVCLDEAQRVETPTAKSAQMALKLHATIRWCVSGTPVGRGQIEDLYGLFIFLRASPFDSKAFFDKCFVPGSEGIEIRIRCLLQSIFWRSTRALPAVHKQMGIPEQDERKVVLQFSSVERHFYDRQLEKTMDAATEISEKKTRQGVKLTRLAEQLHILRAACCHPQVGSSGLGRSKTTRRDGTRQNLSSQVMSMHQILCKLIDDARLKCEESQRVVIMHTNAAAALSSLKVQAKGFEGVFVGQSEKDLHLHSYHLYEEALNLGTSNADPTMIVAESVVCGSKGFQSPRKIVNNGRANLDWVSSDFDLSKELWTTFEFDIAKKITEVRIRSSNFVPVHIRSNAADSTKWSVLRPSCYVLEVSNAAYGGQFVQVAQVSSQDEGDSDWTSISDFLANKTKTWRVRAEFDSRSLSSEDTILTDRGGVVFEYVGLEVEILEASVGYDPLQRLHCLHNAAISLKHAGHGECIEETKRQNSEKAAKLKGEAERIESLYMEVKRSMHRECYRALERQRENREVLISQFSEASPIQPVDIWDDSWHDDFLVLCHLHMPTSKCQQMVDRLRQQLDSCVVQGHFRGLQNEGMVPFPDFNDISGLRLAVQLRTSDVRNGIGAKQNFRSTMPIAADELGGTSSRRREYFRCPPGAFSNCMDKMMEVSEQPSESSIVENRCCHVCKADWNQTGPECAHCKVGALLDELIVDKVSYRVLKALFGQFRLAREALQKARVDVMEALEQIETRASLFFDVLDSETEERNLASKLWRVHLDLLNDLDELNQCKTTMRLLEVGDDLTSMGDDELNAVVQPLDVIARYHDHSAKQAMALGDLRRAKNTLSFLRNQIKESFGSKGEEQCMVCLSDFSTSERAVLRCGHSFHHRPCLERLRNPSGDICCPLRCRVKTRYDELLIATEKRGDDGSRSNRHVKGSWGTKVTRLVSDVLEVCDQGEKCIVFSQWDDMLDICEKALSENRIGCSRSASAKSLGGALTRFREKQNCALLLNVKSGGEGLTVVEATHIFLVEPLLNHGLDSQAIARVNRIGQTRKTTVHRYLIDDTIEIKIDKLRTSHSSDEVEDSLNGAKRSKIRAGGIDGGFSSSQELIDLLSQ